MALNLAALATICSPDIPGTRRNTCPTVGWVFLALFFRLIYPLWVNQNLFCTPLDVFSDSSVPSRPYSHCSNTGRSSKEKRPALAERLNF